MTDNPVEVHPEIEHRLKLFRTAIRADYGKTIEDERFSDLRTAILKHDPVDGLVKAAAELEPKPGDNWCPWCETALDHCRDISPCDVGLLLVQLARYREAVGEPVEER